MTNSLQPLKPNAHTIAKLRTDMERARRKNRRDLFFFGGFMCVLVIGVVGFFAWFLAGGHAIMGATAIAIVAPVILLVSIQAMFFCRKLHGHWQKSKAQHKTNAEIYSMRVAQIESGALSISAQGQGDGQLTYVAQEGALTDLENQDG